MKLEIEYIPISEIKLYPNNAKIHTAEQIEQIKKSIQEFGFNDPIGIWHGECVEGHGRIIAATELGLERVPVIRLDSLTDEQRKAYALVHNKLTMNTDFNVDLLGIELDSILNFKMEEFGFEFNEEMDEQWKEIEKPEETFTEVLGEEHNYIVLYFDNQVDWLQLQSLIDVEEKMNLSTRKDGVISENMKRKSVGRVFNGKEILERLREHYENIH